MAFGMGRSLGARKAGGIRAAECWLRVLKLGSKQASEQGEKGHLTWLELMAAPMDREAFVEYLDLSHLPQESLLKSCGKAPSKTRGLLELRHRLLAAYNPDASGEQFSPAASKRGAS